jgi:hypothetical protein
LTQYYNINLINVALVYPAASWKDMFEPPLQIPLKETITLNKLVLAKVNNQKMELINHIIINGYRGSFQSPLQAGCPTITTSNNRIPSFLI